MALSIGTIKNVTGLVVAKNMQGEERVLKVGDTLFFEDTIRTFGAGSSVVLSLMDGKEIVLAGNDDIFLDKSVYVAEGFGEEAVVSSQTVGDVVDPDAGENAYIAQSNVAGSYGVFNLESDGTWSYVANEAYNELNAGDVISDTFIIKSVDGTVDSSVKVSITGTNDTPVLGSAVVGLNETDSILSTSGNLTDVVDPDAGENAYIAQSNVAGSYGVFNLASDGTWSYVANEAYNELNAGDVISDTFIIKSVDGTVESSVKVSITGTNDMPVASYHEFTTPEDTAIVITNAQLLAGSSDVDASDVLSISDVTLKNPANGTLFDNGNGTYTFVPSYNYSGSALELSYTLSDTSGATASQDVMIHVTPVADAP